MPKEDLGEHCHYKRPIIHTRDAHYFLMQEVPFRRSYARKCTLTRNTLPFYCGVYDHQTVVAPDITLNNPITISAEDCREYHERKEYRHIKTIPETDKEETEKEYRLFLSRNCLSYGKFLFLWKFVSELEMFIGREFLAFFLLHRRVA